MEERNKIEICFFHGLILLPSPSCVLSSDRRGAGSAGDGRFRFCLTWKLLIHLSLDVLEALSEDQVTVGIDLGTMKAGRVTYRANSGVLYSQDRSRPGSGAFPSEHQVTKPSLLFVSGGLPCPEFKAACYSAWNPPRKRWMEEGLWLIFSMQVN